MDAGSGARARRHYAWRCAAGGITGCRCRTPSPVGIGQLAEYFLKRKAPAGADHLEVFVLVSMLMCVASLNSSRLMMARSSGGPTDRFERMVESMETSAHLAAWARLVLRVDHAVDDGLAVFGFADLKVRRVDRGLDEVAGRIDMEQARLFALDLAAQNEGRR